MVTIKITDMPEKEAKQQTFLDKSFCVVSHSGLHRTEATMIERLSGISTVPTHVLITGSRTGSLAMVVAHLWPSAQVMCHAIDVHHTKTMERNIASNKVKGVNVTCSAMIPEQPYDLVFFSGTETTTTAELMLDQLEDIHERMAMGGVCWIAYEGDKGAFMKQIRQVFGKASTEIDQREFFCLRAKKTRPLEKRRSFRAEFQASLPGIEAITLASLPGVFCHRRPDMGGLALAEVAVKEQSQISNLKSKIVDMGCGSGLVGILLAKANPEAKVTFLDSQSRALEITRQNLDALGMSGHSMILSDSGTDETGFDLFVGNPPYFSDFRIAELFVQTALHVLKPGGVGMLVAKTAPALDECIKTCFPETTIIPRRGYCVIRFVK
ncbi:MAG: methyltransferase [bacterium]